MIWRTITGKVLKTAQNERGEKSPNFFQEYDMTFPLNKYEIDSKQSYWCTFVFYRE